MFERIEGENDRIVYTERIDAITNALKCRITIFARTQNIK